MSKHGSVTNVIAWRYMPARLPVGFTALWWLVMERIDAPGWAWGMFWLVLAVVWAISIFLLFTQRLCDPMLKPCDEEPR